MIFMTLQNMLMLRASIQSAKTFDRFDFDDIVPTASDR